MASVPAGLLSPEPTFTPLGGSPMNTGVLMDASGDVSGSLNNAHLSLEVYPYYEPGGF